MLQDSMDIVGDEGEVVQKMSRRRPRLQTRRRNPHGMARFVCAMLPAWCAMMAANADGQLFENIDLQILQQIAGPEPGKTLVPPGEVCRAVGPDFDAWILGAQAEHDSFLTKEAVQEARRSYGPMASDLCLC